MKYKKLGNTEIDVSLICLGTMTWGEQNSEQEAFAQMDFSLDKGINFFDTAELYAVLMVLRIAVPPIRIHTDCELVVKGFLRGQLWCTAPERRHREIWKQMWAIVNDLGGLDPRCVHIIKVNCVAEIGIDRVHDMSCQSV